VLIGCLRLSLGCSAGFECDRAEKTTALQGGSSKFEEINMRDDRFRRDATERSVGMTFRQPDPEQPSQLKNNRNDARRTETAKQSDAEREAERRNLRRLQLMVDMVLSVLHQDPDLTVAEASDMIANCKNAALAMFPDKELAFDLIYRPRFERVMNERFRLQ
jgi:hypothetical protein